jgi:hypothetical protein
VRLISWVKEWKQEPAVSLEQDRALEKVGLRWRNEERRKKEKWMWEGDTEAGYSRRDGVVIASANRASSGTFEQPIVGSDTFVQMCRAQVV